MKLNGVDLHVVNLIKSMLPKDHLPDQETSLNAPHVPRAAPGVLMNAKRAKGELTIMMSSCYGETGSRTQNLLHSTSGIDSQYAKKMSYR
jgi:hypothetical protein